MSSLRIGRNSYRVERGARGLGSPKVSESTLSIDESSDMYVAQAFQPKCSQY